MGAEHCSPARGEDPSLALPLRALPPAAWSGHICTQGCPGRVLEGWARGGGWGVRERPRRAGSLLWQGQLFRKFTFSYCSDRLPKPS